MLTAALKNLSVANDIANFRSLRLIMMSGRRLRVDGGAVDDGGRRRRRRRGGGEATTTTMSTRVRTDSTTRRIACKVDSEKI